MRGWLWVTVYTLLLYATIPFGRSLLNLLKGQLGPSFTLWVNGVLIMAGVALFTFFWIHRTLNRRQWMILLTVCLAVAFIVGRMPIPEERIHLLEYAGLGYLIVCALQTRLQNILLYNRGLGLVFLIGIGDELIQGILPSRIFDFRDIFFNAIGGIMGTIIGVNTVSKIDGC